jgi:hypothetical protein
MTDLDAIMAREVLLEWIKQEKRGRHSLTLRAEGRNITVDLDLFKDLMTQAGWQLRLELTQPKAGQL